MGRKKIQIKPITDEKVRKVRRIPLPIVLSCRLETDGPPR